MMRMILSSEARDRLSNLKLVRPEIADRVEEYLIQLVQGGKVNPPIEDGLLKELLDRILPKKRQTKIERR